MSTSSSPFAPDLRNTLRFLKYCLNVLPSKHEAQEVNRLTLAHFVIHSLDVLGQIELVDAKKTIDWIYSLQIVPDVQNPQLNAHNVGFRGAPFFGARYNPDCTSGPVHAHDQCHIAMNYCALALLAALGDDFSRVNRPALLHAMRQLQRPDGSFSCVPGGSESDMRFVYCAAAVCSMLGDFSGMDVDAAQRFVCGAQRYDGGMSQGGDRESHGGSAYLCVATLALMGRLDDSIANAKAATPNEPQVGLRREALIDWLAARQSTGFQGRINKPPDSCYGFWIGSSLKMLGVFDEVVEAKQLAAFLCVCTGEMGGFAKHPDSNPDVMHTFYSLCALSLCAHAAGEATQLAEISPHLGITERAAKIVERNKQLLKEKK